MLSEVGVMAMGMPYDIRYLVQLLSKWWRMVSLSLIASR